MKRRKNYIPSILLALFFWSALAFLMYAQSPNAPLTQSVPSDPRILFFLLLFLALLFSFALLFQNTRWGMLIALGLVGLILLRFFQLFHPLYFVLVIALLITVELYFVKSK